MEGTVRLLDPTFWSRLKTASGVTVPLTSIAVKKNVRMTEELWSKGKMLGICLTDLLAGDTIASVELETEEDGTIVGCSISYHPNFAPSPEADEIIREAALYKYLKGDYDA